MKLLFSFTDGQDFGENVMDDNDDGRVTLKQLRQHHALLVALLVLRMMMMMMMHHLRK
jgi:hypothetical protein